MFLTAQEVAELTDVRQGKNGRTREQLQIDALRRMKIPFHVSAIGRPKVARSVIDGVHQEQQAGGGWEPAPV